MGLRCDMLPHMKLIITEDARHLQINEFYADNPEDLRNIWQSLREKYSGYEIDFCYHNCDVPVDFMNEIGAKVLESCIETRLFPDKFASGGGLEVVTVTESNFDMFASLHDKVSQGMFWTSERLKKTDLSRWLIYVHDESYVLMFLGNEVAEIYGLESNDRRIKELLLSKAAEYAFLANKANVLYMIDDDAPSELELAQSLGFVVCGKYVAYQTTIR